MKIYSIIVTLVAILALGLAGFLGWQYQDVKGQKTAVEKDMNSARDELNRVREGVTNIETSIKALDAVIESFSPHGDDMVGDFDAAKVTTARQKIGDISDVKDKEMVLNVWDRFRESSRLNDFQQVLRKFIENLNRSFGNISPAK